MNQTKISRRATLVAGLLATVGATSFAQETQPFMGEPLPWLNAAELNRFELGKLEFNNVLNIADGLGPVFNDSSCGQCHGNPRVGGFSVTAVKRAGVAGPPFQDLAAKGGSLFQLFSINSPMCDEVIPPEADVFTDRLTPPTFGAGLVESIDDSEIINFQNNPPSPAVSGFVRMTQPVEGGPMRVGKFGWKGGVATMLTFSADASVNELGLTNRFFTADNAPNGDPLLLAQCDTVPDPEDGPDAFGFDRIDRHTDFQLFLNPPPQFPRSGMTGEAIFQQIGCADCHVDHVYNTISAAEPALNGRTLKPYSDYLLHDMGALGDGIVDGPATEKIMKTAPLWGLLARSDEAMLHDGRASAGTVESNLDLAIIEHDGEGASAKNAYLALSASQKTDLYQFLNSLGRAEFDHEGDNDRDVFDYFFLFQVFTGPNADLSPDDEASISDVDEDGDLDMRDFAVFQRTFTGQIL